MSVARVRDPLPARLTLDELPLAPNALKSGNYQHGIQVVWAGGSIDELVQAIKSSDNAQVSLGKKPAIFLDDKVRPIRPIQRDRSFVYARRSGEKRARLNGVMSIKDAASRVKAAEPDDLDMDAAVLSLQQSLAEHAQKKQASSTVFLKDSLPAANKKQTKKFGSNNALLKPHRQGLFDQNKGARSLPTSPSLTGMTPVPTSKPTAHQLRQQALKTSLIHLLAVRAVSQSYITKTLNCEASDVEGLLEKYGRPSRLDSRKFDLSDRGYKELDIWRFGYKDSSDRQAAIDRSIAAFDRQRISVREPVWQLLLPVKDRHKGKILSKLDLHNGPVSRAKTPQIHVQPSGEGRAQGKTSPEDERPGRLAPSSAAEARSGSQEPMSKSKVSEKEAQAKRLLSKPKKPATAASEMARKSAPKETKSTTDKKPTATKPPPTNSKFKSAEYVVSSDEDTDVEDIPITLAKPAAKTIPSTAPKTQEPTKSAPKASQGNSSANKSGTGVVKNGTAKPAPSAPSHNKLKASDAKSHSNGTSSPLPRKRTMSSPRKPSRLGSSPLTNGSDRENEAALKSKSSSSSNSPLINQRRDSRKLPPDPPSTKHVASSSSSSDRPLKRRSDEISSDRPGASARAHNREREREPQRGSSTQPPPAKRRLTVSPPPRNNGSARSVTPSDAGRTPARTPQPISSSDLQSARRFKEMQLLYTKQLNEVRALTKPPPDRVEKLRRMHSKLSAHKKDLMSLVST